MASGLLALTLLAATGDNARADGGHGGGAGHLGAPGGGFGRYGGYGGYGYGRYGGYGWGGWGFGWGLGLGIGLGYPYYGYPYYGYPYYGYPYYGYPYAYGYTPGAPTVTGGSPLNPGSPPPVPVVPTVGATEPPLASGPDSEVTLVLRTPADATVWINGVKTTQTGARREFVSSGLAAGRSYTFDIRAEWLGADGKLAAAWRRLPVQAGERRLVDLTSAGAQPNVTTADFGGSK
jgi:uncharacterized protein (TIGR03000 family)